MWYVYILKSRDKDWYYIGSANRLIERVKEHNKLTVRSTKFYAPLHLVFFEEYGEEGKARSRERYIKDCRTEKERIISCLKK